MRWAAAGCALVIGVMLAVFGVVLAQKSTVASPASDRSAAASAQEPSPQSTGGLVLASAASQTVTLAEPAQAATDELRQVVAQTPVAPQVVAQAQSQTRSAAPAAPAPPPAAAAASCPGNPNALGVSRVVEVDTTGGPGFGFEHFKTHDFLRDGEVVLTFDDGPWPKNTPAVLAALAAHCTKAIFFPIGKHAMWEPGLLKQVVAAGHAVGSHTFSHKDLSKLSIEEGKEELEKGISAVRWAAGAATAPYVRFPALKHPPELVTYMGERNIAMFSTDFDSFDFKMKKPEDVRKSVMAKLKKHGKGIVLMHDFQHATAEAAAALLNDLKAGGYKIVFMKPKDPVKTLASYDELILKDQKLPTVSQRPTSSVIRTISE